MIANIFAIIELFLFSFTLDSPRKNMNKKEVHNECVWVVQLTADQIEKRLVTLQVDNYVVCEMNKAKKLKNLLSD